MATITSDRLLITGLALAEMAATQAEIEIGDQIEPFVMLEYVNQSLSELHDILTESFSDCFVDEHEFPAGSDDQRLPDGVLRVLRLFRADDGLEVKRATLPQIVSARATGSGTVLSYRLLGQRIKFSSVPSVAIQMWYVQTFARLADISDPVAFAVPVDWTRLVVYDLTARLLALEESDYVFWEGRKEVLRRRFSEIGAQRDLTPQPTENRMPTDWLED